MFSFAHISDVHLAPLPHPSPRELFSKRITGYLNWKKNRENELGNDTLPALLKHLHARTPEHLLISGDIVNLSLDAEFENARQWLLAQGATQDVTLTLGNHDAYVRGAFKKACTTFAPWLTADMQPSWETAFPFMRVRGPVAFISASSAVATPPFCAGGYFDATQAQHLETLLLQAKDEKLFRVVMLHHPPLHHATQWYKKLWGIKRFQNVIRKAGAELILHGHTHLPTFHQIKGPEDAVAVIGVASASQAFGSKKPPANYNWFDVAKNEESWRCVMTRYSVQDKNNTIHNGEKKQVFPLSQI